MRSVKTPVSDEPTLSVPPRIPAKGQRAYEELHRRIIEMELEPGAQLIEGELMDALQVGRTPVREAIQRLATEKMVIARPRQTPYVAPILMHELSEIVEMRFVLEVPAARFAAMRATTPEREALIQANGIFHRAVLATEMQAIVDSDNQIHHLIVDASHNSYLADSSQRLAAFSRRIWRLSSNSVRFDDENFRQCHDEMVTAIFNGDSDDAAAAATEHVLMFKRRLNRLVRDVADVKQAVRRA